MTHFTKHSVLAIAFLLTACGTNDGTKGDTAANLLFLGTANPPPAPAVAQTIPLECPPVNVLPDTGSYRISARGQESDPFAVRYQINIAQLSRECVDLGAEAGIRVGVIARALVGPQGGAGSVEAPLRIAVLNPAGEPVYSRLERLRTTFAAGETRKEIAYVEEGITLPLDATRLRGYRIVVGFDGGSRQ